MSRPIAYVEFGSGTYEDPNITFQLDGSVGTFADDGEKVRGMNFKLPQEIIDQIITMWGNDDA